MNAIHCSASLCFLGIPLAISWIGCFQNFYRPPRNKMGFVLYFTTQILAPVIYWFPFYFTAFQEIAAPGEERRKEQRLLPSMPSNSLRAGNGMALLCSKRPISRCQSDEINHSNQGEAEVRVQRPSQLFFFGAKIKGKRLACCGR